MVPHCVMYVMEKQEKKDVKEEKLEKKDVKDEKPVLKKRRFKSVGTQKVCF